MNGIKKANLKFTWMIIDSSGNVLDDSDMTTY